MELPKKGPAAQAAPANDGAKWYTWRRSYLLGVIPAAMLIVAVALAVFLNRRRRKRRARLAQAEPYADGYDDDYDDGDDQIYADDRAYRDDRPYRDDQAYADDRVYADDRAYRAESSFESGPMQLAPPDDDVAPFNAWASPVVPPSRARGERRCPRGVEPPTVREGNGGAPRGAEPPTVNGDAPPKEFSPDEDFLDTEPTYIESEVDESWAPPSVHSSGPPSGRHAAIQLDEPGPTLTSLKLALEDPYDAPQGYPVKADTKTGLYWTPDSSLYGVARAEIWFASEEFALTNGFTKG